MKKIVFILVLVLAILPVSSAFAATDINLVLGMKPTGNGGNAGSKNFTDGSESVGAQVDPNILYHFNFTEPVDVTSVKIRAYSEDYQMIFTDVDGNAQTKDMTKNVAYTVDYKNIKRVSFKTTSTTNYPFVYEVYVYGHQSLGFSNKDAAKFVIQNLRYTVTGSDSVNLAWTNIDSQYLKYYTVYQNGTKLSTPTTNAFSVSGLQVGKSYDFKVTPTDIFDFEFDGATVTYDIPIPDTTPPDKVLGVKVNPSNTSALVTWDKSSAVDLAGYTVFLDGQKASTSLLTAESYSLTGLTPKTDYRVYVVAQDKAGNVSVKSDDVSFTTTNPTTDSDQEATPDYLLVTWTETAGASGYNIYLNGRQVGSAGPDKRSFKITKAMGYNPANLVNKTEVRATFPDGSEGSGGGGSGGGLDGGHYLDFIGVMPMIETAIAFLGIYKLWIILVLAVIFSPVLYGLIVRLIEYLRKRNAIQAGGGRQ